MGKIKITCNLMFLCTTFISLLLYSCTRSNKEDKSDKFISTNTIKIEKKVNAEKYKEIENCLAKGSDRKQLQNIELALFESIEKDNSNISKRELADKYLKIYEKYPDTLLGRKAKEHYDKLLSEINLDSQK